jgi:hypothetical protein
MAASPVVRDRAIGENGPNSPPIVVRLQKLKYVSFEMSWSKFAGAVINEKNWVGILNPVTRDIWAGREATGCRAGGPPTFWSNFCQTSRRIKAKFLPCLGSIG